MKHLNDLIMIRDIHVLKRVARLSGVIESIYSSSNVRFGALLSEHCPDICASIPAAVELTERQLKHHYKHPIRQGFVAYARPPDVGFCLGNSNVYIDQVTNMSNLALIIRTCAAWGVDSLIYSTPNGIDHLHPLCIQGARGLQYKLPIKRIEQEEVIELQKSMHSIVFDERGEEGLPQYACDKPSLIIFGSELRGVDHRLRQSADQVRRIRMEDEVISINLAVSVGVGLYSSITK